MFLIVLAAAADFESFLKTNALDVAITYYDDSRIQYHYTYFKNVPSGEDMCFIDSPYQCQDLSQRAAAAIKSFDTHKSEL